MFTARKKSLCNKCSLTFCTKCCDNKMYAPGFQDTKVAVCKGCFDHSIDIQNKKKN